MTTSPWQGQTLRQHPLWPDYLAALQRELKTAMNRFAYDLSCGRAGWPKELPMEPAHLLHAWEWLRRRAPADHWEDILGASRRPDQAYANQLLRESATLEDFLSGYLAHWMPRLDDDPRAREIRAYGTRVATDAVTPLAQAWRALGRGVLDPRQALRTLGAAQKARFEAVGGPEDQQRWALIDRMPDPDSAFSGFDKVALIPTFACPRGCRHCLLIRPPSLRHAPDPGNLLAGLNRHARSVLFTGGELAGHQSLFVRAIRELPRAASLGILLNGAGVDSVATAQALFQQLEQARRERPASAEELDLVIQISCDEFHQEIIFDPRVGLRERNPLACVAHLLQAALDFPHLELHLLHKQNALNFSSALLHEGVLGRLMRELTTRGLTPRLLSYAPTARAKPDPRNPHLSAHPVRDIALGLGGEGTRPVHLISSTVEAMGRAPLLDPSEWVDERDYMEQILTRGPPPGECFDIAPMIWLDGTMTLFGAVHYALGNVLTEGWEKVINRWRKDPLARALERFDARLPVYYAARGGDWNALLARASGPHHLFHELTADAALRLELTKKCIYS
ncbi:MAG: hypothetical protein H7831_00425 [Magnetococcus sp. WYHC-3]